MKVTRSGYAVKDGIHFQCPVCNCGFIIEDKNDWTIEWQKTFNSQKNIPYYKVSCPECDILIHIGNNPNDYDKSDGCLISGYSSIFERPDWKERYSVTGE